MDLRIAFLFFIYIPSILMAPTSNDGKEARVITYENENDGSGNYYFRFETSNNIIREETGTLINGGQTGSYTEVEGSVSYLDDNGEKIFMKYSADDKGYHILSTNDEYPVILEENSPLILASLLGGSG